MVPYSRYPHCKFWSIRETYPVIVSRTRRTRYTPTTNSQSRETSTPNVPHPSPLQTIAPDIPMRPHRLSVKHIQLSFHAFVALQPAICRTPRPSPVQTTALPPKQKGRLTRPMFIPRSSASSVPAKAPVLPVASPQSSLVRKRALQARRPPNPSPAHTPR